MKHISFGLILGVLFSACIGDDFIDDFVEPTLDITNPIDSIEIGSSYQFEFRYLNNVGLSESITPQWTSSDPSIASISDQGLLEAIDFGTASIIASYTSPDGSIEDTLIIHVANSTQIVTSDQREGTIQTTSSYLLEGSFTMEQDEDNLVININSDYRASTSLPGFYLYLTNNPNSIVDALEVSKITIFNGAHEYIVEDQDINDYDYLLFYCKPFNIKVGEGIID